VPIDKIYRRNLSWKIPVDMNMIFKKLYVTWPTWPQTFEVIFVGLRLTKNIIFNTTKSLVWMNPSYHACQILYSKGNCETMYHWFFLLEINVVKIMNNLNVCSAHSYLYPRSRFNLHHISI